MPLLQGVPFERDAFCLMVWSLLFETLGLLALALFTAALEAAPHRGPLLRLAPFLWRRLAVLDSAFWDGARPKPAIGVAGREIQKRVERDLRPPVFLINRKEAVFGLLAKTLLRVHASRLSKGQWSAGAVDQRRSKIGKSAQRSRRLS